MPKIGKCLDCGTVKTIKAKGLCSSCLEYLRRHGNHRNLSARICPCCGKSFIPRRMNQKYLNRKHKKIQQQRAYRRKYRKDVNLKQRAYRVRKKLGQP